MLTGIWHFELGFCYVMYEMRYKYAVRRPGETKIICLNKSEFDETRKEYDSHCSVLINSFWTKRETFSSLPDDGLPIQVTLFD